MVRGNLGGGRRKQWTVIGDAVNLASRIEGMTKTLRRDLLFTESVARHLPAEEVELLGEYEIRGQPHPVKCYTVASVGDAGEDGA